MALKEIIKTIEESFDKFSREQREFYEKFPGCGPFRGYRPRGELGPIHPMGVSGDPSKLPKKTNGEIKMDHEIQIHEYQKFISDHLHLTKEETIEAYQLYLIEKAGTNESCSNCLFLKLEWNSVYHFCRRFPHTESVYLDGWCGEWKKRVGLFNEKIEREYRIVKDAELSIGHHVAIKGEGAKPYGFITMIDRGKAFIIDDYWGIWQPLDKLVKIEERSGWK